MTDENTAVEPDELNSFEEDFNDAVAVEPEPPEPDDDLDSVEADLSATATAESADKSAPTPAKADPVNINDYYRSLNAGYTGKIEALALQYEDGEISFVQFERAKASLGNQYADDRSKLDAYQAKIELAGQQEQQQQAQWLEQQHPNWSEEGNSPEFISWLQQQPPGIQVMAQAFDAKNYDYLLRSFKQSGSHQNPNAQRAAGLTAKRQASMAANVSVQSRGAAKAAGEPADFEGLFNYLAEKDQRKNRR